MEHSVLKLVIFILNCFQLLAFFKQTMQNIWYTRGVKWYQKMYLQKVAWKEKEIDTVELRIFYNSIHSFSQTTAVAQHL